MCTHLQYERLNSFNDWQPSKLLSNTRWDRRRRRRRRQAPTLLSGLRFAVSADQPEFLACCAMLRLCSALTCSFVCLPSGACSDHVTDSNTQGTTHCYYLLLIVLPGLTIRFQCRFGSLTKNQQSYHGSSPCLLYYILYILACVSVCALCIAQAFESSKLSQCAQTAVKTVTRWVNAHPKKLN